MGKLRALVPRVAEHLESELPVRLLQIVLADVSRYIQDLVVALCSHVWISHTDADTHHARSPERQARKSLTKM